MPGTSIATATALALNLAAQAVDQSALPGNTSHFFKVPASAGGGIELALTGHSQDLKIEILNAAGTASLGASDKPGLLSESLSLKGLASGDYIVKVTNKSTSTASPYKLRLVSPQKSSGVLWQRSAVSGGAFGNPLGWYSGSTNTPEGGTSGESVGFSPTLQIPGAWQYQGYGNFGTLGKRYVVRDPSVNSNRILLMDPHSTASSTLITYASTDTYSQRWNVRGVADIDGDGIDDLILYNDNPGGTGQVYIYFLNSQGQIDTTKSRFVDVTVPLSLGYQLFGAGRDPNTNQPRLFWFKASTGTFELWNLNSNGTWNSSYTIHNANQDWSVLSARSAGDFDGDGDVDFLMRNSTGLTQIIRTNAGASPTLGEWITVDEQETVGINASTTVAIEPRLIIPHGDNSGFAHSFAGDNPKNAAFDLGVIQSGQSLDAANLIRPAIPGGDLHFRNYYKFTIAAQSTITIGSTDKRWFSCLTDETANCVYGNSAPAGGFTTTTLAAGTYYLRVNERANSGIPNSNPIRTAVQLGSGIGSTSTEVANVDPGNMGSNVGQFLKVGSWSYFLVSDGAENEPGLWRTDGTAAGTTLVKALSPGSGELVAIGSTLYFSARDDKGVELWKSDGSGAGTVRAADIFSGEDSSSPSQLTVFNGQLYFTAQNASNGVELWRFDGTNASIININTVAIPNTTPAADESSNPAELTVMGSNLYMAATTNTQGRELIKVSTSNTVSVVQDLVSGAGSSNPAELTVVGGKLVFSVAAGGQDAQGRDINAEIATSDGSTITVTDLWSGNDANGNPNSSNPGGFTAWGNDVYFSLAGTTGREMGRLNTTNNATTTWDLWSGTTSGAQNNSSPDGFTVLGNQLLFSAENAQGVELWSFAGSGSPAVLKDINTSGSSNPTGITTIGTKAYFTAAASGENYELWESDGTANGTVLRSEINTGNSNIDPSLPYGFADHGGGKILFNAFTNAIGVEPRVLDGTTISLLKDINTLPNDGQEGDSAVLSGWRYYSMYDKEKGQELWRSNGSTSNLVCDLAAGVASGSPGSLVTVGGFIFFSGTGTDGVRKLYKSDGSACTVADNATGVDGIGEIVGSGTNAIFYARTANGLSLRSIASTGSTSTEIKNFGQEGLIAEMKNVGNGDIWLSARDVSGADTGLEPYKLVGSTLTAMGNIGSGNNGADSSNPYEFLRTPNGDVYAAINHPDNGYELYRWVGGTGAASLVSNMFGGSDGSNLTGMAHLGGNKVGWWSYANGGWSNPAVGGTDCKLIEGALSINGSGNCGTPSANSNTTEPSGLSFAITDGTRTAKSVVGNPIPPTSDPTFTDEQKALEYHDYPQGLQITSSAGTTYHYPTAYSRDTLTNLCTPTTYGVPGRKVASIFGSAGSEFTNADFIAFRDRFEKGQQSNGENEFRFDSTFSQMYGGLISQKSTLNCTITQALTSPWVRLTSDFGGTIDPRLDGAEDITLGKVEHNNSARLYMANFDVDTNQYQVWSISHAEIMTKRLDANGLPGQKNLRFEGSFAWERGSLRFEPNGAAMQITGYDPVAKRHKVTTIGGV